jgi:hypothetical protein
METMKRILLLILMCSALLTSPCRAQIDTTSENLWRVYQMLEYKEGTNTETWFIGDRGLVHDIISRLLARGAVRDMHRNALSPNARHELNSLINEDYVEVMCVRRFDRSDIEKLVLYSPHDPSVTDGISPIVDKVMLEKYLGTELYEKVKSKDYPVNGTSERRVESQRQKSFDLYLHLFYPHFMIWQDTQLIPDAPDSIRRPIRQRQWAVSLFGQMGHDYLSLPSWYRSSMIGGLKVSYVDNTAYVLRDKDYETFSFWVGYDESINFSVPPGKTGTSNSFFKERLLQGSGAAIFVKSTWIPKYDYPGDGEYLKLSVEGAVAITEKKGYGATVPDSFYTVRNYLSLQGTLRHLLGIVDVGAGVSWHDLQKIRRNPEPIVHLEPTTNNIVPFFEAGISQDGSLLQFALSTQINIHNGYRYLIVKSLLMLNNWIGVDVRYFNAFGNLPDWHYDNYIMISPVIRINY